MKKKRKREPLLIAFTCEHCGFFCDIVAPDGLEVDNIECPDCKKRAKLRENNG